MKRDVLLVAPIYAPTRERLESDYTVHRLWEAKDRDAMLAHAGGSDRDPRHERRCRRCAHV